MENLIKEIIKLLQVDMLSCGSLSQVIKLSNIGRSENKYIKTSLDKVLIELLNRNLIKIGIAKKVTHNHVDFEAWQGKPSDLVNRAMQSIQNANLHDKEFAFWVCLPDNIDYYE